MVLPCVIDILVTAYQIRVTHDLLSQKLRRYCAHTRDKLVLYSKSSQSCVKKISFGQSIQSMSFNAGLDKSLLRIEY